MVDPTSTRLETEYVHGAGQLLVERLPASTPPSSGGIGGPPGSPVQKIQVTLNQTPFIRDLVYSISADDGYSTYSSGAHPDASGIIEVPLTEFEPGVSNALRVKPADDPASPYSAPVTVAVNGSIVPSSPNQIKVLTVRQDLLESDRQDFLEPAR